MFSVGDDISVFDDSPYGCGQPFELKKGDTFRVLAFIPDGGSFEGRRITGGDSVMIGVVREFVWQYPSITVSKWFDLWPANRFRKVERKRTREELYSLIGIDGMVDQGEGVAA